MIDQVDPFIGTAPADLPPSEGLAATWWWPKPPVGNTHPGATFPFGMVSACAHSGAYPTGYGLYERSTEGVPGLLHDRLVASGFTHFQQSGTGAIRKYYNYLRVSPMLEPLDALGTTWPVTSETALPGYYAATLGNGVRCEITVGPKSAVHRYTFPSHRDARIVIDCSHGGLAIDRGATVPLRATLESVAPGVGSGEVVMEGVPLAFHVECDTPDWRQMLWYVLPSKPRPEFVETFGIALVEKMLAGGGPIITCDTGGIGEAVGPHAKLVPTSHPHAIANALNEIILGLSPGERTRWGAAARGYALQFDREHVFDRLFGRLASSQVVAA